MKMTSNRRLPQTLKWKISATNGRIFPKFYTSVYMTKTNFATFQMKMTIQMGTNPTTFSCHIMVQGTRETHF